MLGPDGEVERTFGERGGGPRRVRGSVGPRARRRTGRGLDPRRQKERLRRHLIGGAPRGRPVTGLAPPILAHLVQGRGHLSGPRLARELGRPASIIARTRSSLRETALQAWSADILLVPRDGGGEEPAVHAPIADRIGDPATKYGAASTLLPYPVWTICPGGAVALYDPLTNTVRRSTPAGEQLAVYALPEERRVEITVERIFEMFYRQLAENLPAGQLPEREAARDLTREQNEELVNTSAGVFPEYVDMACTADGTLWIRPFDHTADRLGQGSTWIRVRSDGARTTVVLPAGFRTFRIGSERIWGTLPDALNVESIVWVDTGSIP